MVLAAGGSRRLGRPKQLLRRERETLLHRAVRLARETTPIRLLVILGACREEIGATLQGLDYESLLNPDWNQGLSSSLHCAAHALAGVEAPILLLVCDQPALELAHLQTLLTSAARSASGCAATAHGATVGIPAVVTSAMLQQATTLNDDRGLRAPLNALDRDRVGVLDAPELALDLDTPADVQLAIARGLLDEE